MEPDKEVLRKVSEEKDIRESLAVDDICTVCQFPSTWTQKIRRLTPYLELYRDIVIWTKTT